MKKLLLIILTFVSITGVSCAQRNDSKNIEETYTSSFFKEKIRELTLLKEKYKGEFICPPSELDTVLNKDKYTLSRVYDIPIYKNKEDTHIIFWVSTNRELLGLEEYAKANTYKNNILVVFEKKDTIYTMCDFFYQPINQGTFSFRNIQIASEEKSLELVQYGGNQFGYWYTEFIFEYDLQEDQWILNKYNLYTAKWGEKYTKDKLIWTKKPDKKIFINEVYFSNFFPDTDLDDIENN